MARQDINLYDASLRIQHDWLSAESLVASVGAALLLMAVVAGFGRWQLSQLEDPARETAAALQAQQTSIQDLARQVETLRPSPKLVADVAVTQSTLEQRQAALQMLRAGGLGDQVGHAATLEAFARQSLDGLWLTGLVVDRNDLALRGRATNPELIPAYVGRLNREPALQGRSFRALDITRPLEDATVHPVLAVSAAAAISPVQSKPSLAAYVEFSLTGSGGATMSKEDKR